MDGQSDRAGGYRDSKVWLVTGCSSGFGRMLVPAITSRGDRVIATARKLSDIQHLQHHERVKVLQLDVTAPEDVLEQRVDEAISMFGTIDILVNNAGYVLSGVWEELR
jgi:NADP-dependent 3-hydroxy acid dehydrogenase YdfG